MIHVDPELCDACGRCGRVCPRYVVETVKGEDGEKVTRVHPERSAICIDCGQCMAICKTGAIRVDGEPGKGSTFTVRVPSLGGPPL